MQNQNPIHYSNQCRTCLNQSADLQSLHYVTIVGSRQMSYGDLLKEVTAINIMDDKWKQMEQNICNCCIQLLNLSHNFIKQALEANDKLWSTLQRETEIGMKSYIEIKTENEDVLEQSSDNAEIQYTEFQVKSEFPEDSLSGMYVTDNKTNQQQSNIAGEQVFSFNEANNATPIKDFISPKATFKRKKYKVNNQEDRARIVNAALRGENWVSIASDLGVNYNTAHHWVASGRTESKPRGGKKTKKLTEDQVTVLISWIERDSSLTLEQLAGKIRDQFNISVAPTTVGNYLDGRLYSCKRFEVRCVDINSHTNKEIRAEYVRQLNQYMQEGKQVAWVGEFNLSLFCRTSRGRPRVPTVMEPQLPAAARGPSINLFGAITSVGVLLLEQERYPFTNTNWIYRILQKWEEVGNDVDLVVVCDPAPCFPKIEYTIAEQPNARINVLRMPPYSRMLNPIQSIWEKVERNVISNFIIPNEREQSLQFLENTIDEAMVTISEEDCARAVHQASIYYSNALYFNDIPVSR